MQMHKAKERYEREYIHVYIYIISKVLYLVYYLPVLNVVHRRWLEQVEQGLGGRRQSIIMNENANENHAVQKTREKKRKTGNCVLMRSTFSCFD